MSSSDVALYPSENKSEGYEKSLEVIALSQTLVNLAKCSYAIQSSFILSYHSQRQLST